MIRIRLFRFAVPTLLLVAIIATAVAVFSLAPSTQQDPTKPVARTTRTIITDVDTPTAAPVMPSPARAAVVAKEGSHIKMPDLGIDLEIVQGDGVNAPLYKAAHYPSLPWPGEGGRSLIYAHARVGMFGPLWGAHVGQTVEVDTADGHQLKYTITQYFPRWPDTDLSILQNVNHEELVLLTCTSWNVSDPRVVAIAEPVGA